MYLGENLFPFLVLLDLSSASFYQKVSTAKVNREIVLVFDMTDIECVLSCERIDQCLLSGMVKHNSGKSRCYLFGDMVKHDMHFLENFFVFKEVTVNDADGKHFGNPASSCLQIKQNYPSSPSGWYWLQLNVVTKVFCDMETDNGGWIQIGKTIIKRGVNLANYGIFSKAITSEFSHLQEHNFLLDGIGLRRLHEYIAFTEVRIFCKKKNKLLHVKVKGSEVLDFVLMRTHICPKACPVITRLKDDKSTIAQKCKSLGKFGLGQIGDCNGKAKRPLLPKDRLYDHFFFLPGVAHVLLMNRDREVRFECDDYVLDKSFEQFGTWLFYVR